MGKDLISREALERIIQRAAELQADERDIGDGLTKDEVLALGKDVGIPNRYLQQALLEEQTRTLVETGTGFWAWLTGPRSLAAQRVVPGDRATVERALARWMEEEESLQVKRRYPDHTTWELKAGAVASIQRALGSRGRRYALASAAEITGKVTTAEPGFCHVGLNADVRPRRDKRMLGGGVVFAMGTLAIAENHSATQHPFVATCGRVATNGCWVAEWFSAIANVPIAKTTPPPSIRLSRRGRTSAFRPTWQNPGSAVVTFPVISAAEARA